MVAAAVPNPTTVTVDDLSRSASTTFLVASRTCGNRTFIESDWSITSVMRSGQCPGQGGLGSASATASGVAVINVARNNAAMREYLLIPYGKESSPCLMGKPDPRGD